MHQEVLQRQVQRQAGGKNTLKASTLNPMTENIWAPDNASFREGVLGDIPAYLGTNDARTLALVPGSCVKKVVRQPQVCDIALPEKTSQPRA